MTTLVGACELMLSGKPVELICPVVLQSLHNLRLQK